MHLIRHGLDLPLRLISSALCRAHDESAKLELRMANKSENDANCKSVCSRSKWVYSFTGMSENDN